MTNDYINEYKILHQNEKNYGASSIAYLRESCLIIDFLKPKIVLDYGCGKGALIEELAKIYPNIEFYGFDPAIEGKDKLPINKADLVINTDVLEHIPEEILPNVLENIAQISKNCFFVLHHALAETILPNGENAHCTVRAPIWYYDLMKRYFVAPPPYPLPIKSGIVLSAVITFLPSVSFLNSWQNIEYYGERETKFIPHRLGHFLSLFIVKSKNRKHFRRKYVKNKN